ncbi:hypothetical protein D3C80_723440 [compost metagenome]
MSENDRHRFRIGKGVELGGGRVIAGRQSAAHPCQVGDLDGEVRSRQRHGGNIGERPKRQNASLAFAALQP